ncbi:ABC-type cobalamin/Fe3+-siderophores transport system ATPase subunit [Ancylobacter sp. 3268]|uniref:AAA family ATPase n=1 Tax=Ancylobacter sp. 3268 TaxID=2817752 RepID=UPI0028583DB1|nr:AAA family ATPase [Ancylobacter sp. 3268]MDR6955512.1 ABC-type cobalamin/Fe3+-siderophores transport system ATPase subunit [Ancylobacter sp. 3268]
MTNFSVPGPAELTLSLTVDSGHPLFIVGRNGTGKSALMNRLRQTSQLNTIYLPGSRTALFDGESLSLTPNSRRDLTTNLGVWDNQAEARWRNHSGNQRNEKAIHDLTAAEHQYKNDFANTIAVNSDPVETAAAIAKLQAKESPLDRVNQILQQANISVQMFIADNELKAMSGGNIFSYARMSDGERIALILIAEVISAKPGVVFLIDEPELHLHRLIITPLISTLIKSRPDCEFVISTHELDLPTSIAKSRVCIVRSVTWHTDGQVKHWDFDIVDRTDDLPEGLVTDILGSRRRVLFTEGAASSLDVPMYSVLFPKVSIRPKGSCKDVQLAVVGVRSTTGLHHTEAFGLIDNDGMADQSIINFQAESIYPLPFFSVESLYYDAEVLAAVATRQAATHEADEEKQTELMACFLADVLAEGIAAAEKPGTAEHLAGRLAERQVRDALLAQMPKREELIAATSPTIQISGQSAYPAELARFEAMLAAQDLHGIIARYPVRHSGILGAIAKALKFQGRADFETAAVARISSDETLRNKLLLKLAPLSTVINA